MLIKTGKECVHGWKQVIELLIRHHMNDHTSDSYFLYGNEDLEDIYGHTSSFRGIPYVIGPEDKEMMMESIRKNFYDVKNNADWRKLISLNLIIIPAGKPDNFPYDYLDLLGIDYIGGNLALYAHVTYKDLARIWNNIIPFPRDENDEAMIRFILSLPCHELITGKKYIHILHVGWYAKNDVTLCYDDKGYETGYIIKPDARPII